MTKKTKPSTKLGFLSGLYIIASALLLTILLKSSSLASAEVKKALQICYSTLIPSLFPIMVATQIITDSGAVEKLARKLCAPLSALLGVSATATVPYLLGLFGGYTASCKSAMLLYQNGQISKNDFETVIAISSIPSLAFVTGFIGMGIFNSSTIGWILWLIAVISTLMLGMINKFFLKTSAINSPYLSASNNTKKHFSVAVINAISGSAYAMITICACVIFFSVLISILNAYMIKFPISCTTKSLFFGLLEITNGISLCKSIPSPFSRALACAFLIGWSGLCIHFQVISLCEDLDISFRKYFAFKGLQGVICLILAWIIFKFKL